jgi:RNA polymerase sigma-70 factor, ECF subfamily
MTATTETIWNEFHDKLFHFIKKRVKDVDTTNDILQDIFIKIHLKLHTLTDQDKLTSWVYQVTRNSILDHFKKQKPATELGENLAEIEEEKTFNAEMVTCMKPFIDKLPSTYKEAILETELGRLSQKAYAEKAGISHSGAKSRVQRARQQLHELFTACCNVQADKYGNIIGKEECKTDCGCQ